MQYGTIAITDVIKPQYTKEDNMTQTTNDAVNFVHPLYKTHEEQVTICNDVYNGIDTAKRHIIQRPLEDSEDYQNRLTISVLNNFVERICTTQAGMIFRKPLSYEDITDPVKDILDEMDIAQFTKEATEATIRDGVGLVLCDIAHSGGNPYFVHINRASLINWDKDADDNYTMAVILEYVPKRDGFKIEYVKQYRHIKSDGNIDLWQEVSEQGLIIVQSITTSYNFVPLYDAVLSAVPPLYDIAKINIAHLNMMSILDNCTATAMQPSLFTKGLGIAEGDTIKFSTNSTINTDNEASDVKWLELDGQSIPYGVTNLERKEQEMTSRALQIQEGGAKTATQVNTENSESSSRLSDIAELIENMINKAFNGWYMMKYNTEAVGKIIVSRDFKSTTDGSLIIGLNQAVVAGSLSRETFLTALNDAEIVNIEDIHEEIKRIDAEFSDPIKPTNETV